MKTDAYTVANYTFKGGSLSDSSGNGFNLTNNGADLVNAYFEEGYDFVDTNNDWMTTGDLAAGSALSFGDGAGNDSPFSVELIVKMDDATLFRMLEKGSQSTGSGNLEWILVTTGADELNWRVYVPSGASYTQFYTTGSYMTQFEGQWLYLAGTYDGSKTGAGMNFYINGSLTPGLRLGAYAGMTNSIAPLNIGRLVGAYADGIFDSVRISNIERSAEEIREMYNKIKGVYGVTP